MKYAFHAIAAFAMVAGMAAPTFADEMMDPATMTCADLMAMDAEGMMAAGTAINAMPSDDAMMADMSDEDVMHAAEAACTEHPDGTVMEAMHPDM